MTILAAGTLTLNDYLRAQFLNLRPRPILGALGVLLIGVYLVALVVSFDKGRTSLAWSLAGAGVYLAALFFIYIPWRTKRTFRQQQRVVVPIQMEFGANDVRMTTEFGDTRLPWDAFVRWRSNKELVLLYYSDQLFHIVPARFFESAADRMKVVELAKQKLGRAT